MRGDEAAAEAAVDCCGERGRYWCRLRAPGRVEVPPEPPVGGHLSRGACLPSLQPHGADTQRPSTASWSCAVLRPLSERAQRPRRDRRAAAPRTDAGASVERVGPISLTPTGSHASTGSSCSWPPASSSATSGRARSTRSRSASIRDHGVAADARERARRPLAHLLVAHDGRHGQVPDVHHAGRQPRRGRHPRAPRARPARQEADSARIGWIAASSSSARRCSTATASSRRPSPCSAPSRASSVATTRLTPAIVPLTVAILLGLFSVQKRGTASIGGVFGPVMVVWFATLGGPRRACRSRATRRSSWRVNPIHAVALLRATRVARASSSSAASSSPSRAARRSTPTWATSGARPIRVAWFALVMPALLLNYFGQGACRHPAPGASRPTRSSRSSRRRCIYPMVALSTAATIIASQALISGAFSLTRQAVQLGFCPRVTILHTSGEAEGQIYVPEVNAALAIACIWLVLAFKESSALAAAYGIAVTGHDGDHVGRLLRGADARVELAALARGCRSWRCSSASTSPSSPPTRSSSSAAAGSRSPSPWRSSS